MQVIVQVNYLAVFVCGVVSMIFGAVWYSHIIFGRTWMDEIDKSDEELKKELNPFKTYGLGFLFNMFIAFSLAQLLAHCGANTIAEGIRISFLCWFGFFVAPMLSNSLHEKKSIRLVLIDSGYHLINILFYGIILGGMSA
jgi:hypothetical protein